MNKLKIGFIGLGLMGRPMARNLYKAGYPLSVFNKTPEKTKEFVSLGAKVCYSPAELAQSCDVLMTMITGPKDVDQVMSQVAKGSNPSTRFAHSGLKGLIAVDMSTIGVKAAKEISKKLSKKGIEFLDAPVTGGTTGAEKGTLTIFVGGEEKVYKKLRPVFEAMGKDIWYMGGVGTGQAIKLVNNLIAGETIATLAEAFLLADEMRLPRKKMGQVLENVFAVSPNMRNKFPNMIGNHFPTSFSISNIRKDLGLALGELKNKKLPLLKAAESLYAKGVKKGMGNLDLSGVIKVLEDK